MEMTVDYPKMARGGVDAILSSVYLPESPLLYEVDPKGIAQNILEFLFKARYKGEYNQSRIALRLRGRKFSKSTIPVATRNGRSFSPMWAFREYSITR